MSEADTIREGIGAAIQCDHNESPRDDCPLCSGRWDYPQEPPWLPEPVVAYLTALERRAEQAEAALRAFFCDGCGHGFRVEDHVYGVKTCCPDCSHGPFIATLATTPGEPTGDRVSGCICHSPRTTPGEPK